MQEGCDIGRVIGALGHKGGLLAAAGGHFGSIFRGEAQAQGPIQRGHGSSALWAVY